ncbi:MAG: type II 3-dehydroquinate dehydratase [Candidatus Marinimicrobia bacterium]|nr:type II 3-dehydroquinate dehydratase [Candidatus Neomarinimicrobiota bacterium]MDD9888581.1 type II 3-dehydroquinate dehydratase [Candidatus Neomarinimicrobiota bacterium]MDD9930903.1 type II 3-dehydroquinate dehydratase [Candidatus Neomarinimicrobiota bacterium]
MNIIILHGPNLNLIGFLSAQLEKRTTLDKINRDIRRKVRNQDVQLKIEQTHKVFQAINFIQRNRNWADAIIFAPMAWARYEYAIGDALKFAHVKTTQVLFTEGFGDLSESDSIYSSIVDTTLMGEPDQVYLEALDSIIKTA